jgi:hypothetical protein
MQSSPEFTSNLLHSSVGGPERPAHAATVVYQAVTIAAMLLLIGSLWVF